MGNFHTINPATGQKLSEYSYQSSEEINQTIDQCHQSWKEWKKTSFPDRAHLMNNLSSLLADQKEELGKLIWGNGGNNWAVMSFATIGSFSRRPGAPTPRSSQN